MYTLYSLQAVLQAANFGRLHASARTTQNKYEAEEKNDEGRKEKHEYVMCPGTLKASLEVGHSVALYPLGLSSLFNSSHSAIGIRNENTPK